MGFKVRTDHGSHKWLLKLSNASGRLARCRLQIDQFDFDIGLRACVIHQAADASSRSRTDDEETTDLDDNHPVCNVEKNADDGRRKTLRVCLYGMQR